MLDELGQPPTWVFLLVRTSTALIKLARRIGLEPISVSVNSRVRSPGVLPANIVGWDNWI